MLAELNYAQPLPWYRRHARRAVVGLLIVAAISCAAVWSIRFMQQVQLVLDQRRATKWVEPPKTIIFSEGYPQDALTMLPPAYRFDYPGVFGDPHDPVRIIRTPANFPASGADGSVFLHARRSGTTGVRLVNVTVANRNPFDDPTRKAIGLQAVVDVPATLRLGSGSGPAFDFPNGTCSLSVSKTIRVYAGQPDPTDESHFTIDYEADGKTNTIDGWLMPDDSVKLEPRIIVNVRQ